MHHSCLVDKSYLLRLTFDLKLTLKVSEWGWVHSTGPIETRGWTVGCNVINVCPCKARVTSCLS